MTLDDVKNRNALYDRKEQELIEASVMTPDGFKAHTDCGWLIEYIETHEREHAAELVKVQEDMWERCADAAANKFDWDINGRDWAAGKLIASHIRTLPLVQKGGK